MKKLVILTALLLPISATSVAGEKRGVAHRFTEYADVIDVQPIFREVSLREPRRECWVEQQQHVIRYEGSRDSHRPKYRKAHRSGADTVVGGIIGGVIGNQLGRRGSDGARLGATVAGAIIGSAVVNEAQGQGNRRGHRHRRHKRHGHKHYQAQPVYETREVERCKDVYDTRYEKRLNGYNVTYRYRDQTFTTQMNRDPGSQIELQVSVKPARSRR